MTSRTKLWALSAGALALSLALAGCGGGGSSSSGVRTPGTGGAPAKTVVTPAATAVSLAEVTTDGAGYEAPAATGDEPLEIEAGMSETSGSVTFMCAEGDDDCTVMVAADGTVTSTGGTVTAMNSEMYQASLNEADALSKETALRAKVGELQPIAGAAGAADSALTIAAKYAALLGTEKSDGDSMVAMENAQKVLDAQSDLKAAIDAAKEARTAAMEAKDALGEDGDADVINTLEAAITDADGKIEAAEEILTGTALAGHVADVTGGTDADPQGTPTSIGETVAKAVAVALGPTVPEGGSSTADGGGFRVVHVAAAASVEAPTGTRAATNPVADDNKFEDVSHDPESMTWAEIVGADDLMDRQINTGATDPVDTRSVKVASIAGMKVVDVFGSAATLETDTGLPNDTEVNGAETTTTAADDTTNYMGIPGTVICGGTDCAAEDGELTGSWYFTPTDAKAIWKRQTDDTATTTVDESELYEVDTLFATYGHWLVVDDGGTTPTDAGNVHVVTYAYGPTAGTPGDWAEDASGTPDSEQATYEGTAVGRSVHRVSDEDVSIIETHSGLFTANVELTAKFGDTPKLGGTVSGFTSDNPNAVDEDWTVTLKESDVEASTGLLGNSNVGVTEASGQDGEWSAHSYGASATVRPAGIYGGFTAHFTDGDVAGAYATRND